MVPVLIGSLGVLPDGDRMTALALEQGQNVECTMDGKMALRLSGFSFTSLTGDNYTDNEKSCCRRTRLVTDLDFVYAAALLKPPHSDRELERWLE